MKKFFLIFFGILFVLLLVVGVASLPFDIYWTIVNGKYQFAFYRVLDAARMERFLSPGEVLQLPNLADKDNFESKYWKLFHVANYTVSVPLGHPRYITSPVILEEDYKEYLQLGMNYLTQTQKLLAQILYNESGKFQKHMNEERLFELPIVKNILESKSAPTLWKDLFTKDLTTKKYWDILHIPLEDLAYNLYLIHLRTKFFPKEFKSYSFYERSQMGVIELVTSSSEMKKEVCAFLVDGVIESYTLNSLKEGPSGLAIRERLMDTTEFTPSMVDKTKMLYEEFRELPYATKISPEGMVYLFAAWSHSTHDKEFLREIIGHLERGEGNLTQLQSLYVYAFRHYGDKFSGTREKDGGKDNKLGELGQKIKEEEKKELLKEGRTKTEGGDNNLQFNNKEEQMKYFLQKAKEKKKRASSNSLIFD